MNRGKSTSFLRLDVFFKDSPLRRRPLGSSRNRSSPTNVCEQGMRDGPKEHLCKKLYFKHAKKNLAFLSLRITGPRRSSNVRIRCDLEEAVFRQKSLKFTFQSL